MRLDSALITSRETNGLNGAFKKGQIAWMKKASITEARNNLSVLIDGLKNGSPVLIMDRGRPVARLEPVTGEDNEHDERLAQLVRDGLVRPRRKPLARSFLRADRPAVAVSAVDMLIAERREGR